MYSYYLTICDLDRCYVVMVGYHSLCNVGTCHQFQLGAKLTKYVIWKKRSFMPPCVYKTYLNFTC